MTLFLACCVAALTIMDVLGDSSNQFVQVTSFTTCPDFPGLPNVINETSVRTDYATDDFFVTGTLQLREPIETGTSLHVTINKCVSGDEEASCSSFLRVTEEDFCAHMADQDKVWSPVIAKIQDLDPVCPVPVGDYLVKDAQIGMKPLEEMHASNGFYEIRMLFMHREKPQLCVMAKGKLRTLRKKKKKQPGAKMAKDGDFFRKALAGRSAWKDSLGR